MEAYAALPTLGSLCFTRSFRHGLYSCPAVAFRLVVHSRAAKSYTAIQLLNCLHHCANWLLGVKESKWPTEVTRSASLVR